MSSSKEALALFSKYVHSSGKYNDLINQSKEIDTAIDEAHKFISELKIMYDSIDETMKKDQETPNDISRHEDISKFLESGPPKLLLPDMEDSDEADLDIDQTISKFKDIAEKIKNSEIFNQPINDLSQYKVKRELVCDDSFLLSLQQLSKCLANVQTIPTDHSYQRNKLLEEKLTELCHDVELFTKMVESKTQFSKCNEEWDKSQVSVFQLQYTDVINKLLGAINDLTLILLDQRKYSPKTS